jgi:hypothetical protein
MWSDILKSTQTAKLKGSIIRNLLLEYVEETDYQNEYIIEDVVDSIYSEYRTRHKAQFPDAGLSNLRIMKRKLTRFFGKYFPEGYERIIDGKQSKKMIKLDQRNNLEKSKPKVKGDIFRRLLLEHVEKTGYQDVYDIDDVIESIYEEYIKEYKILEPGRPAPKSYKHKRLMRSFINRGYFPQQYIRNIDTMVKRNLNSDDIDIEKIRTRRGDRLKLKDWETFKRDLRAGLNTIVPRDIYGRKSSVRIVDGDFVDNKATLNVSFRSLQTDRRYIFINFVEEEGDYYFTTIEGNVQIFDDEVIQTEAQLRERVIDLVEEFYVEEKREYDLREKEEGELTEEENIRQLEAANPDSYWDRERAMLVPKEKPPEEQESRNLNLEEAAKLGAKAKEKADKLKDLLAERKRKKTSMSNIKPQRGKRGRKDVP